MKDVASSLFRRETQFNSVHYERVFTTAATANNAVSAHVVNCPRREVGKSDRCPGAIPKQVVPPQCEVRVR